MKRQSMTSLIILLLDFTLILTSPTTARSIDEALLQLATPAASPPVPLEVSAEVEPPPPVLVVAKAGPSSTFGTVREALDAANMYFGGTTRVVIRVESGVYDETVVVTRPNVTLIGDGIGKSIITGKLSAAGKYLPTYETATFRVEGDATGFVARGMTFQNTYGVGAPAVAFQSAADKTVLYECSIEGFQDTLDVYRGRHLYKDCRIQGAVDFIFGFGAAVFQDCFILLLNSPTIFITAQGKDLPTDTPSGFVFHRCQVRAGPVLDQASVEAVRVYLGRPWRSYAKVVFIKTYLDGHINPTGWSPWHLETPLPDTVYFGECLNQGPGANVSGRVSWPGLHLLTADSQASEFSIRSFLLGDGDWLFGLGVPFDSTL